MPDAGAGDGGVPCEWESFGDGIAGGAVGDVQFDVGRPGVAWAVSGASLYRSEDRGGSWREYASLPDPILALGLGPDAGPMIAATRRGLSSSTDDGLSWRPLAFSGLRVEAVAIHPGDGRRVVASVSGAGLFRSVDGGGTWRPASDGTTSRRVLGFATPTDDPRRFYASAMVLNDEGGSADRIELLVSRDGGESWTVDLEAPGRNRGVAVCPQGDGDTVVANVGSSLARSEDGGRSFVRYESPLENADALAFSPADCERIYAIAWGTGLWRSDDGGLHWDGPFSDGLESRLTLVGLRGFAVDPQSADRLLAASSGAGFLSESGGESWDPIPGLGQLAIRDVTSDGSRLWLTTWGSGLWTRDVATDPRWRRLSVAELPADYVYTVAPSTERPTIVATSRRIYIEDEGGRYRSVMNANVLDLLRYEGLVLGASQDRGALRSDDDGRSWSPDNDGLAPWPTPDGEGVDVRRLVEVRAEPGRVLLGSRGNGLWARQRPGDLWRRVSGFDDESIGCLEDTDAGLFACVEGRGVLRSTDGGRTWHDASAGLPAVAAGGLTEWTSTGRVFAAFRGGAFEWKRSSESWERVGRECVPGSAATAPAVVSNSMGTTRLVVASEIDGPWAIVLDAEP